MPDPFDEIAAMVAELHPRHAETRRPVEIEADAPARVRAFWQAMGASQAVEDARRPFLTREASRAPIDQAFEDWHADPQSRSRWKADKGPQAFWSHLPARLRLASVLKKELTVTDETGVADDPPVLVMRRTAPPVFTCHGSYVQWLIWNLLGNLTVTRSVAYNRHCGMPGTPVAADIFPKLAKLADGVWWMEIPYKRPDSQPMVPRPIFYRSIRDYFAFLLALPDDKLPFFPRPAAAAFGIQPLGALDLQKQPPPGFRVFTPLGPQGEPMSHTRAALGAVDGTPVWLAMAVKGDEVSAYFNPRDEQAVRAWLSGVRAKVVDEDPMAEGYDRMGW